PNRRPELTILFVDDVEFRGDASGPVRRTIEAADDRAPPAQGGERQGENSEAQQRNAAAPTPRQAPGVAVERAVDACDLGSLAEVPADEPADGGSRRRRR